METMYRFLMVLLWVALGFGQTPSNKPPADIDEALRARINQFYGLQVEGKFRAAEALVADDTKDFYYSSNKVKYLSFETKGIEYSDNFTQAKATVVCERYFMAPGFMDKPLKIPVPSTWKIVDGQWYWYVDPDTLRETPFGKIAAAPTGTAANSPEAASRPAVKVPTLADMNFIFTQVKADKQQVNVKPGESQEVTFSNTAPGPMNITLVGKIPGISFQLDRTEMKAGEKAVLTVRATDEAKAGTISVQVEQTNQVIPIQVNISN